MNTVSTLPTSIVDEMDGAHHQEILAWLEAFAAAVRAVDYEAGKRLFAPQVVGFGTVGVMLEGLETLVASQWRQVWGVTHGFRFHQEQLRYHTSGDIAWVAVPW